MVGQGSARSGDKAPVSPAVVRRRDKLKIRPEFPILRRPIFTQSHMRQPWRGAKVAGRTANFRQFAKAGTSSSRTREGPSMTMSEVLRRAQASGGLSLGRGGQTVRGVKPEV